MKRTATITFHKAISYGAVLQSYALQQAILKLGIENEIINYDCKEINKCYNLIRLDSIKFFIKSIVILPFFYFKKKNFEMFIKKYIKMTSNLSNHNLYSRMVNNRYDMFITGSDQVWNYELTGLDKAYFLDFVENDKKKKCYAASFGIEKIPEFYKDKYRKLLKCFSTILIREKTGAKIIKELINKDAITVLDPVFLLNNKEWEAIIEKDKFDNIKNKYILVYMPTPDMKKFTKILSKKYNLPIYNITDPMLKINNNFGKIEATLGPSEFVNAIKNAKFVVTSSFHATVFSIIFNKEFFININSEGKSRGSRLTDLLCLLEIDDREIANYNIDSFKPLNWEKINRKLEIEKQRSIQELKQMLEAE